MSALCRECSDAAGNHWRRWAELALGDAPTVRASSDQDLRRALVEQARRDTAVLTSWISNSIGFEIVLWTADNGGGFRLLADDELTDCIQRAIDTAPRRDPSETAALKQQIANLKHTIEVMAEAVRVGDVDAVRMHHEHVASAELDLSVRPQECRRA